MTNKRGIAYTGVLDRGFPFWELVNFTKTSGLHCLFLLIVIHIFLWQDNLLGGQFLGNGQVEFTGWAFPHPINVFYLPVSVSLAPKMSKKAYIKSFWT